MQNLALCFISWGTTEYIDNLKKIDKKLIPTILFKYPSEDSKDHPISQQISQICLPEYSIKNEITQPSIKYSIITELAGTRLYCTTLTFYERNDEIKRRSYALTFAKDQDTKNAPPKSCEDIFYEKELNKKKKERNQKLFSLRGNEGLNYLEANLDFIYHPKSITLISLYPIHFAMREILAEIYRITQTLNVSYEIPIEFYIAQIIDQIKLPIQGENLSISFQIGKKKIEIPSQNEPTQFPRSEFPLTEFLFGKTNFRTIYRLLNAIMFENKVVITSKNESFLTIFIQLLLQLFYPFQWLHILIPSLPPALLDVLGSPTPFIIGLSPSSLELAKNKPMIHLDELVICNLDTQEMTFPEEHFEIEENNIYYRILEAEVSTTLYPNIHFLSSIESIENKPKPNYSPDLLLRISFSHFFGRIIQNYKKHIIVLQQDPLLWIFHTEKFIQSDTLDEVLKRLTTTAAFHNFVKEHVSTKDNPFDDFVTKLSTSKNPILDYREQNGRKNIFHYPKINHVGKYVYHQKFPKLDKELFLNFPKQDIHYDFKIKEKIVEDVDLKLKQKHISDLQFFMELIQRDKIGENFKENFFVKKVLEIIKVYIGRWGFVTLLKYLIGNVNLNKHCFNCVAFLSQQMLTHITLPQDFWTVARLIDVSFEINKRNENSRKNQLLLVFVLKGELSFQDVDFWKKYFAYEVSNKKNETTKSGRKKDLLYFVSDLCFKMIHLTNIDLIEEWRDWIIKRYNLTEKQAQTVVTLIQNVIKKYNERLIEYTN